MTTRPTSEHVRSTGIGDTQATTENIAGITPIVGNVTTSFNAAETPSPG